ncbi:glutamine amidotransferase [Rhodopseudomonas sp. AAP120]|uniref:glutamine amidotransferase n=1 Tax=Rhodopseudomonas sp. AAP120 TaxID=1523430 RepID=UPI0006BA0676|nr:glutamine amidotransferase [Rhodopseudomonas sp. AAP120]KPG00019.1 glutamine amidotransferase [Rhodopseudomonas sp. AAP120]
MNCVALRHVAFEHAGLVADSLAARGHTLRYVEVGSEPLHAEAIVGADLLVVLGGPIGVYETEDYPFLVPELDAIRARLATKRPTLGICLGAQLIAAALGARVAPAPAKEIGYAPLTLTDAGMRSVLASLAGVDVLHWHGDNLDLPAGAERLASTAVCPNQGFSIGSHTLGLQFHIETPPSALEAWLIGHTAELGKVGIKPGTLRAQAARSGAATVEAGRRVIDAWLDSVLR